METILRQKGFEFIRQLKDGTYVAQYRNTTYYGLYTLNGIVRQK